jgi:hypothetical protein
MTQLFSRISKGQGAMRTANRESTVVDTNLGPCLIMGALSWLLLFTLYQWLG